MEAPSEFKAKIMPRYITPSNTFDRAAMMRAAWVAARGAAKVYRSTPRAEFSAALSRVWSIAKAERSYALWLIEQEAERVRAAALPLCERAIMEARTALLIAEHSDADNGHELVARARARLRSLEQIA